MLPEDFNTYPPNNTLTGINGTLERPKFLDIWMMAVGKHVPGRQSKRS